MRDMMIDTHIHFWKLDRGDYGWIKPENKVLYRDFLPQDLEPLLQMNRVSDIIVVQAAETIDETKFLLQLAKEHSFIKGVIGWLDIATNQFQAQYEQVRTDPYFRGVRSKGVVIDNCEAEQWKQLVRNLSVFANDGHVLDLIMHPHEMPSLLHLLSELPNLQIVINHVGLPLVQDEANESWYQYMKQIADHPNIMCKISGMVTFVEGLQTKAFEPYIAALLEYFGTRRLMFGSDWPVGLKAGNYDQIIQFFLDVLPDDLSPLELDDIYSNNAMSVYLKSAPREK